MSSSPIRVKTVFFPVFTERKYSFRICNTKYTESTPKMVYASKHIKEDLDTTHNNLGVIVDRRRGSVIFVQGPSNIMVDWTTSYQTKLSTVLRILGFNQGVTYFGRATTKNTYPAIEFRTPTLSSRIAENRTTLRELGILVE